MAQIWQLEQSQVPGGLLVNSPLGTPIPCSFSVHSGGTDGNKSLDLVARSLTLAHNELSVTLGYHGLPLTALASL